MSPVIRCTHRISCTLLPIVAMILVIAVSQSSLAQVLKEFDADYLQSPPEGPDLTTAEAEIVDLTNEFRNKQKRLPLKVNKSLARAAGYFAAYLARTDKFGHEADGNQPWERASLHGYDYCFIAENIAYQFKSDGFSTDELGRIIFDGWKQSPRHRDNMLNSHLVETGVAIGYSPRTDRYYAVQLFGRPESAAIEFEISNHTPETIRYTVEVAGSGDKPEHRSFELPPQATMFHTRCRPPRIDWRWTVKDDDVKPRSKRAYVITKIENDYRVTAQPASE